MGLLGLYFSWILHRHISHAFLLWKVWESASLIGVIHLEPWTYVSVPGDQLLFGNQDLQRRRAQGSQDGKQKFYSWVVGSSHFYPLITRPICSGCGRKIAPLCFRYILYLLQHVQYPRRLHPILSGCRLPLDTLESSSAVTLSQ